jgi:DNA primase
MALISKSTIDEVNARLDAVSIVGDYVRLEKKSGRWWGRCPFHGGGQEKTPSFKVDPDLKMYHCFGCSKGGSVIGFVMEMDKLTYPQAIKNIAGKMGIEIIYEEGSHYEENQDNSAKDELYELYKRTTGTFRHFLHEKSQGQAALKYLKERGFSKEIIDTFNLGFSPPDRDFLHKFLREKGYSDDFLSKSGLFSANYRTIPLFSGRIMFPISDKQGRIVAFGGRALPGGSLHSDGREPPKYINSPETEIYKKGQTLFAIELAKQEMRTRKTVYLAEGYMDVMALHQAGLSNSLASLGTSFTDEQASLLRQWVDKVTLIFDSDEAGLKAAYKAIITCRKNGLSCALVNMEEGLKSEISQEEAQKFKDPADILSKFGHEILKKILKFVINDFEYLINRGRIQYVVTNGDKNRAVEFMFPFLDVLDSEIDRSDCITRIADIYKIERSAVQKVYSQWKSGGSRSGRLHEKQVSEKSNLQIRSNDELKLLVCVALNMELYPEFRAALEIKEIDDWAAKELFIALEDCYKHDENSIDSLLARINDENLKKFVSDKGTSGEFKGDLRKFTEDGINLIRIKSLKKKITEINAQMRESERTSHSLQSADMPVNVEDLLAQKKFIDLQIRKLEGR